MSHFRKELARLRDQAEMMHELEWSGGGHELRIGFHRSHDAVYNPECHLVLEDVLLRPKSLGATRCGEM